MAKVFFVKNSANQDGCLLKIASNDDMFANHNGYNSNVVDSFEISDADFNAIVSGEKTPKSHDGTNINWQDLDSSNIEWPDEKSLQSYLSHYVSVAENWMKKNNEHPLYNKLETYLSWIKSLDTSSLTPMSGSFEKYAISQSKEPVHLLELI